MTPSDQEARLAEIHEQLSGNRAAWVAYGKINEQWALHTIGEVLDLLADRDRQLAFEKTRGDVNYAAHSRLKQQVADRDREIGELRAKLKRAKEVREWDRV